MFQGQECLIHLQVALESRAVTGTGRGQSLRACALTEQRCSPEPAQSSQGEGPRRGQQSRRSVAFYEPTCAELACLFLQPIASCFVQPRPALGPLSTIILCASGGERTETWLLWQGSTPISLRPHAGSALLPGTDASSSRKPSCRIKA